MRRAAGRRGGDGLTPRERKVVMSPVRWSLPVVLLSVLAGNALAQPERGGGVGPGRSNLPQAGSILPEITVFDDQGNKFSSKSLRGHYSVLVFGCLT